MSRYNRVHNYTKRKISQPNPRACTDGRPPAVSSTGEGIIPYSSSEFSVLTQDDETKPAETAPVRIKHLKQYPSKGKLYRYHYPSRIRIRAEPGTREFAEEMARAEAEWRRKRSAPGSLGETVRLFQADAAFLRVSCVTRKHLCSVVRWLPAKFAGKALADVDTPFLLTLRRNARAAHGTTFANAASLLLQLVISWAIEEGRLPPGKAPLGKRPTGVRSERRRLGNWRATGESFVR